MVPTIVFKALKNSYGSKSRCAHVSESRKGDNHHVQRNHKVMTVMFESLKEHIWIPTITFRTLGAHKGPDNMFEHPTKQREPLSLKKS